MIKLDEKGTCVYIFPILLPSNISVPNLLKKVANIRKKQDLFCLQIIRLDYVASKEHILSALWHALKSFENQRNISRSLETELLLYLSGQRQIKQAIELMGIQTPSDKAALVIVSTEEFKNVIDSILSDLNVIRNPAVSLDLTKEKKELIKDTLPLGSNFQSFEDKILQMVALTALQGK